MSSLFSSSTSSSLNHFNSYCKTRSSFGGGIGLEDNNVSVDQLKRKLSEERDEALEDLKNVETAFSDLHKKYERAKGTMGNLKKNEDLLIARDSALLRQLEARDAQLAKLREEMQSTLERMHSDYEAKGSSTDSENARLRALVRKTEVRISALESDLEQKVKENSSLNKLCDDLINGNK